MSVREWLDSVIKKGSFDSFKSEVVDIQPSLARSFLNNA